MYMLIYMCVCLCVCVCVCLHKYDNIFIRGYGHYMFLLHAIFKMLGVTKGSKNLWGKYQFLDPFLYLTNFGKHILKNPLMKISKMVKNNLHFLKEMMDKLRVEIDVKIVTKGSRREGGGELGY